MRRSFLALSFAVLAVLTGCASPSPTATQPVRTPTPQPAATSTGSGAASLGFFLTVSSPANESTVRTSSAAVQGQTSVDAVVSVNGQPVEVDASGNFTVLILLREGPNVIEVVANDFNGHSGSNVTTVIYAP